MSDESDRLQFLLDNLAEGLAVEVKNWLGGLQTNDERARLAKEVIALANNGGGDIFIGFEDAEPHDSIAPQQGELEAFTQDKITSLVEKYLSPPCQCSVRILRRKDEEIPHPVISVPGGHRTPVFANKGAPDDETLKKHEVYIRRPGGKSEAARNQDDWEKLLDRLVKARQSDQLDAIRQIIDPSKDIVQHQDNNSDDLAEWITESLEKWNKNIENLSRDDPRRFKVGYWYVAFKINSFRTNSLSELQEFLDRNTPKFSSWPPFTFLHRPDSTPVPVGDNIEAWLGHNEDGRNSDFWRISRKGYAFLLRPFQEDRPEFGSNTYPGPPKPVFDWILPSYRMAEILHYLHSLAQEFADEDADFTLNVTYVGMKDRTLWCHKFDYFLDDGAPATSNDLQSEISGKVSELDLNLNEYIWRLLYPVYEQFGFSKLEKGVVDSVIQEVHKNKRR